MNKETLSPQKMVTKPFDNTLPFYSSELKAISELFGTSVENFEKNEYIDITYDKNASQGLMVYKSPKSEESIWVLVCRFSSKKSANNFSKSMENFLDIFKIRGRKKQVVKSNYTDSFNQFVEKFNEMRSENSLA